MRGGLCFGVGPRSGLWFCFLVALRMRWRMGRLCGSNTSTGCSAVIFDRAIGVWCSYDLGMESIYDIRYEYSIYDYSTYISTPKNSLEYPLNGTIGLNTIQSWWGNTVFTKTGDWNSVSLKTVAPGDTFGCVQLLTLFSFSFFLCSTPLCSALLLFLLTEMPRSRRSPCRETRHTGDLSPHSLVIPLGFLLFRRLLFSQYLGRFPLLVYYLPLTIISGAVHNVQRHVLRNTRRSSLSCFFAS